MATQTRQQVGMYNVNRAWNIRKCIDNLVSNSIIPRPKGRVVYLGTQEGPGVYVLRRDHGIEIVGVEEHEEDIKQGIEKGILLENEVIEGDYFEFLESFKEKVDGVVSFFIDCVNVQRAYELGVKVLKPRGMLLFTRNISFPKFKGPEYYQVPMDILDKWCLYKVLK